MPEDTTQESVELSESVEDQTESTETQGVEGTVDTTTETLEREQTPEDAADAAAEASLWETLRKQKGWETEEDAAKGYKELESEFTRRSQNLKDAETKAQAVEQILEAIMAEDVPDFTSGDEGYAPVDDGLARDVKYLKGKSDLMEIAQKYPDFDEHKETMADLISRMPAQMRDSYTNKAGAEMLYRMAKVTQADNERDSLIAEGKKQATVSEMEKARAAVAGGTKAKQAGPKAFTRADIDAMSVEEYSKNESKIMDQLKKGLIK